MKTAPDADDRGAVHMTADQRVEFQVHISHTETEPSTWNVAHTDRSVSHLDGMIYTITLNEQKLFKKQLTIHLIDIAGWRHAINVQVFQKPSNTMQLTSDIQTLIT
jgi:hypothetical protein